MIYITGYFIVSGAFAFELYEAFLIQTLDGDVSAYVSSNFANNHPFVLQLFRLTAVFLSEFFKL